MPKIFIVPEGTETPETLQLALLEDDNIFLLIAECAMAQDRSAVVALTDGDLDFIAKNRLQLPFEPVLLMKIPGVKYSRFFLLCQSTFESESYDTLESGIRTREIEKKEQSSAIAEELRNKTPFKPPRIRQNNPPNSESSDDEFAVEEE